MNTLSFKTVDILNAVLVPVSVFLHLERYHDLIGLTCVPSAHLSLVALPLYKVGGSSHLQFLASLLLNFV